MRVLIVSTWIPPHVGGVEQFVGWAERELAERGHEVRVVCCAYPGVDAAVVMPTIGPDRWPVPRSGYRALWRQIGWADVVFVNCHLFMLSHVASVMSRLRGRPGLFGVHGAMDHPADSIAQRIAARVNDDLLLPVSLRTLRPLSVSRAGAEYIESKWGLPCDRMPFPARTVDGRPSSPALDQRPARIVWAARLAHEKAPLVALEALDQVAQSHRVEWLIYGDGPYQGALQAAAGSRPWITLMGSRPWDEVLAAQRAAHLCLSASIADNVQLSLLEPLARGIPCVSTQVGDAPDYYTPDLGWACVAAGDPDALAGAVTRFLDGYNGYVASFASNGGRLRAIHGDQHAAEMLDLLLNAQESR